MLAVGVVCSPFHDKNGWAGQHLISTVDTKSKSKAIDVVLANLGCLLWKQFMKWTLGSSFNLLSMIFTCVHAMETDCLSKEHEHTLATYNNGNALYSSFSSNISSESASNKHYA